MTGASASGVLTYPVAALLAEPAGSRRDFTFDGIWLDMGDDLELAAAVAGLAAAATCVVAIAAAASGRSSFR